MAVQSLVVDLVVVACATYAAWTLMPAAARRSLAALVLRLSLPASLARPFRRALGPASACGGCDSCGDSQVKPVTLHRRPRH